MLLPIFGRLIRKAGNFGALSFLGSRRGILIPSYGMRTMKPGMAATVSCTLTIHSGRTPAATRLSEAVIRIAPGTLTQGTRPSPKWGP